MFDEVEVHSYKRISKKFVFKVNSCHVMRQAQPF